MNHSIRICDLSLSVRLGCLPEERAVPQEVRVSAELRFSKPPQGAESDELEDTICYAQLSEAWKAHAESREFKLVEKMAADLHAITCAFVRERSRSSVELALTVRKVKPPVAGLLGGVEYRVGDFH